MRLLLRFSILFISFATSYSFISNDKNTLLQIKKSFNNPPLLSSWNPQTDHCNSSWDGVFCTNRRVTYLLIFSGEISGPIPVQIGDLIHLKRIEFYNLTNLNGNIPRSITKLKNLELLFLNKNNLSGLIPDYISELKNLVAFELASNHFTGPIPGWLSQMPKLYKVDLTDNKLTGKIPESLSKLDISMVNLSRNGFIGDGSMFFGLNKKAHLVDISRNKFEFDLSNVKFSIKLVQLDLSHNRIFGKLPEEMSKLSINSFNVSYNRMCGKIPHGGRFQSFDPSVYSHNQCLCGAPLQAC